MAIIAIRRQQLYTSLEMENRSRTLTVVSGCLVLVCLALLAVVVGETLYISQSASIALRPPDQPSPTATPLPTPTATPKPLLAYTFENLRTTQFPASPITLGSVVSENESSVARKFSYTVPITPSSPITTQVTGLMNVPKKAGQYPVVVMFRGYVPQDNYHPGDGTQPAGVVLARSGLITLAPDFLGYAESAPASDDAFEARFQTYTTALTLLSSLPTLNTGLNEQYAGKVSADLTRIGLWGHSNGGHIALSVLAISGARYPTVLWAPVSVAFPYSILYYTDDVDDHGKALRLGLARFEANYDAEAFSPPNYYSWIKAPVQIHQGTSDQAVLSWWTDQLVATLKKDRVPVEYFSYPGADHNLRPSAWSTAVQRSINFYNNQFAPR